MSRTALALLAILALAGCATTQPLDFKELTDRTYGSVHSHVNHNQRLDNQLTKLSTLNLAVHILGAAESIKQGHAVREKYGIDDPSVDISLAIANVIGDKLKLPVTNSRNTEFRSVFAGAAGLQDETELATKFGPEALIVNVGSTLWAIYRRGGGRYAIGYQARVEIIDSASAKSIWKGNCFTNPLSNKEELPLASTMLDNNAESLRQAISQAKDSCIQHVLSGLALEARV